MDFSNVSALNKKFDAIWAMNSLLHIEKSKLGFVLEEINKVLHPAGLFYMGVYGGEDWEGLKKETEYPTPRFFSFFSDEKIKEVVSVYFDIVQFETLDFDGQYCHQSIVMRKK